MNEQETQITTDKEQRANDFYWLIGCVFITIIALFLRFYQLELKPLHHDEGVNGFFLTTLFRSGTYKYDPSNYHGPDLYYIALAFSKVFGLNTISIRGSVAIFGVLTVVCSVFPKEVHRQNRQFDCRAVSRAVSRNGLHFALFYSRAAVCFFQFRHHSRRFIFYRTAQSPVIFAGATMVLLLLVCFLPSALNLVNAAGFENETYNWILTFALIAVEAVLIFLIMRMLLGWQNGRPIYLLLASASAVLLFATKETAFITVGTMALAVVCVWLWRKIYKAIIGAPLENEMEPVALNWTNFRERLGVQTNAEFFLIQCAVTSVTIFLLWLTVRVGVPYLLARNNSGGAANVIVTAADAWNNTDYTILGIALALALTSAAIWLVEKPQKISSEFLILSVAAAVVFLYVGFLFFTSFFTYPEGISKAFEAYAVWTKTGSKDHTQNGTWAYIKWGMKIESPILILSAFGTLIALVKARHRFALFTGFWAFGMFAAYTLIPYKTPWLALSFLLPMCLIAGYGINELFASRQIGVKILAGLLTIFAAGTLGYQTYDLNFVRYDDDSMPYVYAHTRRGFLDLIKQIEYYADKSGKGKDASIEIVSPDYWSMPWYLRDYPKAIFHGQLADANTSEMIVASEAQKADLTARYGAHYKYIGTYPLRPGVELYLLVRRDLADPNKKEIYQIGDDAP